MSERLEFPLINYNGILKSKSEGLFSFSNRSFMYGDGLFETVRISNSRPLFLSEHFERLFDGAEILGFRVPKNRDELREEIIRFIEINHIVEGRMRLALYRNDGGYYAPDSDEASYLISASALSVPAFQFNEKGLHLGIHPYLRKSVSILSEIKSTSALQYVMAARYGKSQGWDDTILLNDEEKLCETASSNLFLVLPGRQIVTPKQGEGLLPGVFRKNLLRCLSEHDIDVSETTLTSDVLLQAEELFICNSIKGIQWVVSYGQKRYFGSFTRTISQKMNNWTQHLHDTLNSELDYPES
jgi:branched-chain amino acid aminotransferase